jgi:hypothetical protein
MWVLRWGQFNKVLLSAILPRWGYVYITLRRVATDSTQRSSLPPLTQEASVLGKNPGKILEEALRCMSLSRDRPPRSISRYSYLARLSISGSICLRIVFI